MQNLCMSLVTGMFRNLTQVLHKFSHCQLCLHKCIIIGHEIVAWSRVLPQKLTGPQLLNFPSIGDTCLFITTFTSASHLSLYPEPDSSSLSLPIPPLGDPFCYFPPIYAKIFQVVSFPQISHPKDCTRISCLLYMLHAPSI